MISEYEKVTDGERYLSNNLQFVILSLVFFIAGIVKLGHSNLIIYISGAVNLLLSVGLISMVFISRLMSFRNKIYTYNVLAIGLLWLIIQIPAAYLITRSFSWPLALIFIALILLVLFSLILAEAFHSKKTPAAAAGGWIKENYPLFLISGIVIFLDQLSKSWVRDSIGPYEEFVPFEFLRGIFGLVNIKNSGAAFGMFQDGALFFGLLALAVSCVIIYYYTTISNADWMIKLALSIQLGGAVGNLLDRMLFAEVTDFLYVHGFPVFNVADSAVSVGCVVIILGVWIAEKRETRMLEAQQTADYSLDETPIQ